MAFDSLKSVFEYIKTDRYSLKDGKWNEKEHPRGQPENAGSFVKKDRYGAIITKTTKLFNIDEKEFTNPTRSYSLPPLKQKFADAINKDNKELLLTKHTIERMIVKHPEMKDGANRRRILNNALNNFTELLYCRPNHKPNYYTIVKTGNYYEMSVIDTDKNKEYFEIVDWRKIDQDGYDDMIDKMEREDGQFLITDGRTNTGRLTFPLFRSIANTIPHSEAVIK